MGQTYFVTWMLTLGSPQIVSRCQNQQQIISTHHGLIHTLCLGWTYMYLFLVPWHLTKPAEELVHGLNSHINPRPCCSSAISLQAVPVLFKACSVRTRIASPVHQGNEKAVSTENIRSELACFHIVIESLRSYSTTSRTAEASLHKHAEVVSACENSCSVP